MKPQRKLSFLPSTIMIGQRFMAAVLLATTMMTVLDASAATLCVDERNISPTAIGTPVFPYTTVQAAVEAAEDGDTVRVAAGVYNGDVRIENKAVLLEGGFTGGTPESYLAGTGGDFETQVSEP